MIRLEARSDLEMGTLEISLEAAPEEGEEISDSVMAHWLTAWLMAVRPKESE